MNVYIYIIDFNEYTPYKKINKNFTYSSNNL